MESFVSFSKEETSQSLPSRLEKQVKIYGQRLAVQSSSHQYTYESLNHCANAIANRLLASPPTAGSPVALLCNHNAPLIAAILGVLKSGNFYAPLDPWDSPKRLRAILHELGSKVVITDRENFRRTTNTVSPESTVLIFEELENDRTEENPRLQIEPDSLAYVYFTSGSTGIPKGVKDTHRNVLHNTLRYTNSLKISKEDRLSLLHSPRFSAYVSSMFSALLNGASVFLLDIRESGFEGIAPWLVENRISIYHSVPEIFRKVVNDQTRNSNLRLIRLEGDAAKLSDIELFKQFTPDDCRLVNGLGTTETGICSQFFVDKQDTITERTLPIGYPVEDMKILVCDSNGDAVAPGEIGEIIVHSPFLSPGYWNDSQQTKKAFSGVPGSSGMRSYKTGDLGRMSESGCLELLGRISNSIKQSPEKTHGHHSAVSSIRSIDNSAMTAMEKLVSGIWTEVLERDHVSVDDVFFDLDGDSMKAMQIIARLRKELSTDVSLRQLLDYPVLKDFAKQLS